MYISIIGIGITLIGIVSPIYCPTIAPYAKYILAVGIFLVVFPPIIWLYRIICRSKTNDALLPIYRIIRLNLDKWEGIANGSIIPRKKSEKDNIYVEINRVLEQYHKIIMKEKKLDLSHLAAHDAVKEFTKFPEAGIQPDLFLAAKEALSKAFKKEEKAHNKANSADS